MEIKTIGGVFDLLKKGIKNADISPIYYVPEELSTSNTVWVCPHYVKNNAVIYKNIIDEIENILEKEKITYEKKKNKFNKLSGKKFSIYVEEKKEFKFNVGNISEAIVSAAIAARFINKLKDIRVSDVKNIIENLPEPTNKLGSKQVKKEFESENENPEIKDKVILDINLSNNNMEAFLKDFDNSRFSDSFAGSVKYANYGNVKKWADRLYRNNKVDKIEVNCINTFGRKVDFEVRITNDQNKLLKVDIKTSLKTGDVKQFGQKGGINFKKHQNKDGYVEFFNELFGIDVSPLESKYNKIVQDEKNISKGTSLVYAKVKSEVEKRLRNNNNKKNLIKTLSIAIKKYATLNEDLVKIVQINKGDVVIYDFNKLLTIIDNMSGEWKVKFDTTSHSKLPIITIQYTNVEDNNKLEDFLYIRLKKENKSDGTEYYRNYIEKGPYMSKMSDLAKKI